MPRGFQVAARLERAAMRADREMAAFERRLHRSITTAVTAAMREARREQRRQYQRVQAQLRDITDQVIRDAAARDALAGAATGTLTRVREPLENALRQALQHGDEVGRGEAGQQFRVGGEPPPTRQAGPISGARLQAYDQLGREWAAGVAADTEQRITRILTENAAQDRGWGVTDRALQAEGARLSRAAGSMIEDQASRGRVTGKTAEFEAAGVEYVRIIATADERVCGYCAERAGRIYELGDVELPFHRHCRCTMVIHRPEWAEDGIAQDVDAWYEAHRRETLERAAAGGHAPDSGLTPSERAAGRRRPAQPVEIPPLPAEVLEEAARLTAEADDEPARERDPHLREGRADEIAARARVPVADAAPRARRAASPPITDPDEAVRHYGATWVNGSRRRDSVALKYGIAEELGQAGDVFTRRAYNISGADVSSARLAARTMYRDAQAQLAASGYKPGDTITLYRGVKEEYRTHGVAESWTSDRRIAERFAGEGGVVWAEQVPVERILTHRGAPGWQDGRFGNQREFIVLRSTPGGNDD